jgi:hypothetical protein
VSPPSYPFDVRSADIWKIALWIALHIWFLGRTAVYWWALGRRTGTLFAA